MTLTIGIDPPKASHTAVASKTSKEALRALKRRLSDVIYRHLVNDAKHAAHHKGGSGRTPRNDSDSSVTGSTS